MTSISNYRIIKSLGEGSFAKVKLAIHNITNQKVAIKVIKQSSLSDKVKLAKVKQEAKILSSFNHPHIMRVYEFIESNEGIFIVMEYLEGGELYEFILGKQRFSEDEARKYFQQLIHALGYCHSHGVVHRDVKPENILLDDQNNIKLGDFGLSTYFNDGIFLKTSCGSLNYAAPEIIAGEIYSGPEVDIWSAGVVLFLLVSGYLPFDENNMYGLFQKIKSAEYLFPHNLSEACKDLISRMLDTDPVTRISISQINHHPWYTINIQNHLTYDTNCMLKKDQTMCLIECKARSSHILDEEIFKKCLQFNLTPENYTEERLRRRLVKQKQDEFCVAYRIMQDTNEKKKRDELNNMSLDIVPTFTNTRNSIDRPSCELRRSLSVIEDFDTLALLFPHNWMIGFRTTLELAECMKIFLKSCKSNNLVKFKQVMKKLNTFHYQFKNEKIRFVCKIFKVMGMKIECAYVVDFRRAFGPSMHFLSVCADVYRAMHLINKRIHRFCTGLIIMASNFTTKSGAKIVYELQRNNLESDKVVVLVHGTFSHKRSLFFPMLYQLQGFNVLGFDLEGNGESDGEFLIGGFDREVENIHEVVQFTKTLGLEVICLIGHSKGGNSIMIYGSRYSDVPILLPIATRFDMSILPGFLNPILSEIESNGFAYLSMNNRSFKVEKEGIEERRNLDMVSVLNKIQSKVIILFGNKDQFTPPSDAYRLRDLLGDRCVKFLMIEEADHFFMTTQEELLTKVHDALVEVTSPRV